MRVEIDTQLIIAKNLDFISHETYTDLQTKTDEMGKLLNGLIKYRKARE